MAHPQYRANGWDPPVTNTQVFAFSGYIVSTALYIGMVASSGMAATGAAIGVVAALSVVVIAMYLAVSTIDPAVEPRSSLARSLDALATAAYCFRKRYDRAPWQSWCAKCRKVVPGLDHHCPWLNTDIGRRNYAQFFALNVAATAQFGLSLGVGVSLAVSQWGALSAAARAMLIVQSACALALVGAFGMLLTFHIYLVYRGLTTYDFLVEMRTNQRNEENNNSSAAAKRKGGGAGAGAGGAVASSSSSPTVSSLSGGGGSKSAEMSALSRGGGGGGARAKDDDETPLNPALDNDASSDGDDPGSVAS